MPRSFLSETDTETLITKHNFKFVFLPLILWYRESMYLGPLKKVFIFATLRSCTIRDVFVLRR